VTTELVSENVFRWFLTLTVGGVGLWLVYWDLLNMSRALKKPASPARSDKLFGCFIGLGIAVIAITGTMKFNHWLL
jgi:hypothetical protein